MAKVEEVVRLMLAQEGDEYVFGAEVSVSDPDPERFDCSELIQWACGRAGVSPTMPDGSWLQARHCRTQGSLVPISDAIRTRGALLFRFSSQPWDGARPSSSHVAVSLGDGRTIEARSTRHGVGVFTSDHTIRGWTHAALIPGVDYQTGEANTDGALVEGADSSAVGMIQERLQSWNPAALPVWGVDGDYGPETSEWVSRFQAEVGLDPSGKADGLTVAVLVGITSS